MINNKQIAEKLRQIADELDRNEGYMDIADAYISVHSNKRNIRVCCTANTNVGYLRLFYWKVPPRK